MLVASALAAVAGDVAADEIPDHKIEDGAPGTILGAPSDFFSHQRFRRQPTFPIKRRVPTAV